MMISSYYASSVKVQKLFKEGRGQGIGSGYLPWIKTHDYSSIGRVTRIHGIKTGRIHQLQSDNQYRAFLIFEFSDALDIRESYPLLDVMEVINSENLRFDKFCDKETSEPYVITTNFLLTVKDTDGKERYVARTIKNTSELKRKITWEKLEIEKRYWTQQGVDWKIITEKQLPRQLAKNIEWVRETLLEGNKDEFDKEEMSIQLQRELYDSADQPLKQVLHTFDKTESLQKGSALLLFRYLLAKKELRVDMSQVLDFSLPFSNLKI